MYGTWYLQGAHKKYENKNIKKHERTGIRLKSKH